MNIKKYLNSENILLDIKSETKKGIIEELLSVCLNISDENYTKILSDLIEREELSSTGMQEGIAIPHIKTEFVDGIYLSFGLSKEGKNFNSLDGRKSNFFFLIVSSKGNSRKYMNLLSDIAGLSMEEDFLNNLIKAETKEEILNLLNELGEDYE